MLFIADANVFVPMVEGLRHMGHDVFDVKERDLAQNQRRILITMDKDFSSILLYPPGEHYGIIVVKLYRLKVAEATKLFIDAINDIKPEDISGNLVIIDRGKTRIRKEKLED